MYGTDNGFAMWPQEQGHLLENNSYKRRYIWNERDQLIRTEDNTVKVNYTYGADGNRASKYTTETETLYFNSFWTWHFDAANQFSNKGGQFSKHIYLGNQRIATVLLGETSLKENEITATFYYHTDHLGSASLITDYKGNEFQRIEYTPYGEVWTEKQSIINFFMPYKFTGKELDEETGLYYYGARYLDPKYSLWKSTDPALGEYIPVASTNDDWSKKNSNLPGMGGVFNPVNLHLYHYAGNNPINYTDPDGKYEYKVQAGDTLSQLVQKHNKQYNTNYTYTGIALHNGIKNPDRIRIGQIIDIPIPGEEMRYPVYHPLKKTDYSSRKSWTRADTENTCTWIGIVLGIGAGISIFICPVATPFIMGLMVVNDGVNITCRALDYSENPTDENLSILIFSGFVGAFDLFGLGSELGFFNSALAKTPLFRFSLNSIGRPFYKATGQFMAYNVAAGWWTFDYLILPVFENVAPDIYKNCTDDE